WVKNLPPGVPHPWITSDKTVTPIHSSLGESVIGTPSGHSILYRLRVGKGEFIYIGWNLDRSIPGGRTPSTIERERGFEEQVQAPTNTASDGSGGYRRSPPMRIHAEDVCLLLLY